MKNYAIMKQHPIRNIIFGIILIYLGWNLGGFFKINYVIGIAGLLLGIYQLYKSKKQKNSEKFIKP